MSLLIDRAPLCVFIEGHAWNINADFRTSVLFEQLLNDVELSEAQRTRAMLNLYFSVTPKDINAALNKIAWFYRCGKEIAASKAKGKSTAKQLYDFEQDADLIFAAFKSDYNIDLEAIRFLHWWKFKPLFENLRSDNLICKIMEYRGADLGKMKGEQKTFYTKMQRLYAIKRPKAEQERNDKINDILLNGGDLSGLENQ